MKIKLILISILLALPVYYASAQQEYYTKDVIDTLRITRENIYMLKSPGIIPHTERLILRNRKLSETDYDITYSTSTIKLAESLPYSLFDTLYVSYKIVDLDFRREYKKRTIVYRFDEKTGDTVKVLRGETGFSPDAIFGANMEKSGTLIRGFTVGTTKDFTLNSGLRLQLAGNLSEEIEIVAALTDENTPIQPEGNTERLEELDKVFIQIKHPLATGIFGDYVLTRRTGEFGFIDRKLQGLTGEFKYDNYDAFTALASSKGKFNTNQFNGLEGVQGPYRLSGINNERDIIIIAGTEKVFVDGVEMKRGEGNDYTIEYGNAQLTFTPRRLITSASRITVDFEYTDRRYTRNLFGAGTGASFLENKLTVRMQYIREGDDPDAPIDAVFSEEDKAALESAGDDRFKAVRTGVSLAQPDSLGIVRGIYSRRDTIINNSDYTYFVYNPGDTSAIYNITFSYVGEFRGDYARQSLGNYRFAGPGQGSYLPVVFLPLPELKQTGNIVMSFSPEKDITMNLEFAGSLWDKNRYSGLEDNDNAGSARNIFIKIEPRNIKIGSLSLGKGGISYKDRYMQERFSSADRINEIEFNRLYNSGSTGAGNEQLREINLTFLPVEQLYINSMYGYLSRGGNFKSDRFNNTLRFGQGQDLSVNYNFDYVETENSVLRSYWLRQKGDASYKFLSLRPGVEFLAENKEDKYSASDSLILTSLKYNEIVPFLELLDLYGFKASARFSFRDDYLPLSGIMNKESNSLTQFYEMTYSGIREVNSSLSLTLRKKKYSEPFRNRGNLDTETILMRSQSRFRLWEPVNGDLFYEVSTQRSARLEKVFVKVERGTGNYIYSGDLNGNGVADENEYQPVLYDGEFILLTIPSDELYPVIDLKASTRWKVNFGDIFGEEHTLSEILSPFSTETFYRIEENSTEQDYSRIYLLNPYYLLNENTTIRGTNYFQQDFFVFENDPELSFRLRYTQRKSLNQYSGGTEAGFFRERSLRINFKLVEEISNQTDLINLADNVNAPLFSNRKRAIIGNGITTDFSYRPVNYIEAGLKLRTARNQDYYPQQPTVIDINSIILRFNLSFAGTGRLRIEIERNELIANTSENYIPFELTDGNFVGKNYFWRLNFDYRISSNLQSSISYDGRLQAAGKVIHTGKAEVRAYF